MLNPLLQLGNNNNNEGNLDHFKLIKQCPICSKEYLKEKIKIVERDGNLSLMHITCPGCEHAVIALVGATQVGIGLMGAVTDLSVEDVLRLREAEAMTDDELLEASYLLRTQSKQFVELLA